jgi:hypothetical protein
MKLGSFLRWLLLLPLALAVAGCFWGDESITRQITGHYYLNGVSDEDPWYLHFEDEEWGLADALISSRIAEAGFNAKCIVLRAASPGPQFYIVPLSKAGDIESRVYIFPLTKAVDPESREAARRKIIGPLAKAEFQAKVRQLNNGALVPFDPDLTAF